MMWNKLPKLILTDIDGVWTDGGMYYDQTGNEWKKFSTYDSAGVLFAHQLNIPVGIITGENTNIVKHRAQKLHIEYVYQGVKNKVKKVEDIATILNITLEDVAYIGDDINDVALLRKVGFSATPANAKDYIKEEVQYVTTSKGGSGAFREFVEKILSDNQIDIKSLSNQIYNNSVSLIQ